MRIKIKDIFAQTENYIVIFSTIKHFLKVIINKGYTPSTINIYISYVNEDGEIIDCSEDIASEYEVVDKELKNPRTKFYYGEVVNTNDEAENKESDRAYIYELYRNPIVKEQQRKFYNHKKLN